MPLLLTFDMCGSISLCVINTHSSGVIVPVVTPARTFPPSHPSGENTMLPGFGQCQDPTERALYSLLANRPVPLTGADQPDLQIFAFFPSSSLAGPHVKLGDGRNSKTQQVSVSMCCEREKMRGHAPVSQASVSRARVCVTH